MLDESYVLVSDISFGVGGSSGVKLLSEEGGDYLGMVGRFRGDDPGFRDFQSD